MMKVVGEEGTPIHDFVTYLKGEYLDGAYLQQDAFDPVDGATTSERQKYVFSVIASILSTTFSFESKDEARGFFQRLTQTTLDWNRAGMDSDDFQQLEETLRNMVSEVTEYA
jgi:V/A-type H+-transporting ATPase subunit A